MDMHIWPYLDHIRTISAKICISEYICGISNHIWTISWSRTLAKAYQTYQDHICNISRPYQDHICRYGSDMVRIWFWYDKIWFKYTYLGPQPYCIPEYRLIWFKYVSDILMIWLRYTYHFPIIPIWFKWYDRTTISVPYLNHIWLILESYQRRARPICISTVYHGYIWIISVWLGSDMYIVTIS